MLILKKTDDLIKESQEKYPHIIGFIKWYVKKSFASRLLMIAGMILSPPLLLSLVQLIMLINNESPIEELEKLKNILSPEPAAYILATLIIIASILIYFTKSSASEDIQSQNQPKTEDIQSQNQHISRILDIKLGKLYLIIPLCIVLSLMASSITYFMFQIIWNLKIELDSGLWLILIQFIRSALLILSIILPIYFLAIAITLFKIKKLKLIFIPWVRKNLFLEYGEDGFIYLTAYQLSCLNCKSASSLYRYEGNFFSQCIAYPKNAQHTSEIDPRTFTKYSVPKMVEQQRNDS